MMTDRIEKSLPVGLKLVGYVQPAEGYISDNDFRREMTGTIELARKGSMTPARYQHLVYKAKNVIRLDVYDHGGVIVSPSADHRAFVDEQWDVARGGAFWICPDYLWEEVKFVRKSKREPYLLSFARKDCKIYSKEVNWFEPVVEVIREHSSLCVDAWFGNPTTDEDSAETELPSLMQDLESRLMSNQLPLF